MGPFFSSYTGTDFLLFYLLLLATAVAASLWMPGRLRPEGRDVAMRDAELLAYLSGGPARFADSVAAALVARSDMRVADKNLVPVPNAQGRTRAEQALLRDYSGYGWNDVLQALSPHADAAERQLEVKGLLLEQSERWKLRLLPALPFAVLLLIGLYRRQAGAALGEPVDFLSVLMMGTLLLAVVRLAVFNPRTHAGNDAVEEARNSHARLSTAPTREEMGLAVGLFGTSVLVGTPFMALHTMRHQQQGGDSGGGSGCGSDGGSGCGGGGCGGCGG